jgi:hypothetical protein
MEGSHRCRSWRWVDQAARRPSGAGPEWWLSYLDGVPFQAPHVFVYGFAKSERDNIDPDELEFWQRVATALLRMDGARLNLMINQLELEKVSCDE